MINFLINFILYSDKLADLHKEFIFGMKDSFSSMMMIYDNDDDNDANDDDDANDY